MRKVTAYHHTSPPSPDYGPGFRPHVFAGLWCRCGASHYQGVNYYATVRRDDGDARALAGPYAEHSDALAILPRVTALAYDLDPRAPFYSYGTAAMKGGYSLPGLLNDRLAAPDLVEPVSAPPKRRRARKAVAA